MIMPKHLTLSDLEKRITTGSADTPGLSVDVISYIENTNDIERVFKIEALRAIINRPGISVGIKSYTSYILDMYK